VHFPRIHWCEKTMKKTAKNVFLSLIVSTILWETVKDADIMWRCIRFCNTKLVGPGQTDNYSRCVQRKGLMSVGPKFLQKWGNFAISWWVILPSRNRVIVSHDANAASIDANKRNICLIFIRRMVVRHGRRIRRFVLPVRSSSSRQLAADAVTLETAQDENIKSLDCRSYRSRVSVCVLSLSLYLMLTYVLRQGTFNRAFRNSLKMWGRVWKQRTYYHCY